MLGQLDPCGGGDPIPLRKPVLSVGRRSRCDIALRFPNVSSNHCQLELIGGHWFVRDLGSSNGIRINERKCESGWLAPGDELRIASHRYVIRYEAKGERPPMPASSSKGETSKGLFGKSLLEKAGLVHARFDGENEVQNKRTRVNEDGSDDAPPLKRTKRPDSSDGERS